MPRKLTQAGWFCQSATSLSSVGLVEPSSASLIAAPLHVRKRYA